MENFPVPPLTKPPAITRANAMVGAALQAPLRGRFLFIMRLGWWALALVTIGLFLLTIPTRYSQLVIEGAESSIALGQLGLPSTFFAFLIGTLDGIIFVSYTLVGMLIFSRKSQEWIGLLASMTLITAVFAIVRPFEALLFVDAALRVPILLILALAAISVTIFVFIFPDGHFEPRWARWLVIALCAFIIYSLVNRAWIVQPITWPPAPLSPVVYLGIFAGALVQVYRYRRVADAAQREQMWWVVFSVAIGALGLVGYFVLIPALFPRVHTPGMTRVLYMLIAAPVYYLMLLQLPIALAVSIFRYHLWDIDFIISRTLVYVLLTAILAGLFSALETVMQNVFVLLTGEESTVATVIATLIVVAAFTPVKDTIQKLVEQRFKDEPAPSSKLETFQTLVRERVSPLYAPQIARRLLSEAVNAFDAKGGGAFLQCQDSARRFQTIGDWDGQPAISVLIQSEPDADPYGWIALMDRKNGQPYSDEDFHTLDELAKTIAVALTEDADADRD